MIHRTFICPGHLVDAARNLGACLSSAGAGMFITPASPTGAAPATHYASSGLVDDVWSGVLSDPDILYAAAQQGAQAQGLTLTATHQDAIDLLTTGDISDESWEVAFARLGLMLVADEI
ncbi:MAG TPA: hypothetical protein PLC58_13535 [Denitromonas sp.]|nr:hypothetical protein [Denitromonas sp.]